MKQFAVLFSLFVFSLPLFADDIVGQTANYTLDKNSARTSSMISSGTVSARVAQYIENSGGGAYQVQVDYNFVVEFLGNQTGSQKATLDKEYFTPEFLDNLRKNGTYVGSDFKAKHMGYADATNLDGQFYPHCDLVELYDLKQKSSPQNFLTGALGLAHLGLQNVTVLLHIYPGIPVLGGVKIDVAGDYSGMHLIAGGDYISP